jgi:hypothetical protein
MAAETRRQLISRIEESESENEDLKSRLEEISDLATDEDEDQDDACE